MATIGLGANITEFIGGVEIDSSLEWKDLEIEGEFSESSRLSIQIERLTFVRNAFRLIKSYLDAGNIFEGLDYTVQINNINEVFERKFWLELSDDVEILQDEGRIQAKAILQDGQAQLESRLSAINYGYLESIGVITSADYVDVDYVVEKRLNPLDMAITLLTIYTISSSLESRLKDFSINQLTSSSISASSPTGGFAGSLFQVLSVLFEAALSVILIRELKRLVVDFLGYFLQPKRTHKGIFLKTLLSKAAAQLGYKFETDLTDLDHIVYLPSNTSADLVNSKGIINRVGSIQKGIPNAKDFGYTAIEAYRLAQSYFNAQFQVVGDTLQFRSENSPYWVRTATYQMPSVWNRSQKYNTADLAFTRFIFFLTDIRDDFTIDNFKGTNYQIVTDLKNPINPDARFIKNLIETPINCALGTRKDRLTSVETILKSLADIADSFISVFGGNSNFASQIKNRVGALKVSNNNHSEPKLIWFENGSIPRDHREKLSARVSWEKYWSYKSFVQNNGIGQKLIFENIEIPFGFRDFLEVSRNSRFKDQDSNDGQIVNLKWLTAQDKATVTYWIRQPYTFNLKESFIEQE